MRCKKCADILGNETSCTQGEILPGWYFLIFLLKWLNFPLDFINFELILVTKNILKLMGVSCFH